jgi:hypothetical protein
MLLDNDGVIRCMLRLGQAHMIRQSVRMLKQIPVNRLVQMELEFDLHAVGTAERNRLRAMCVAHR